MSKVKIEGNANGSGTLTISAPNTNTDRSLTLPDNAGEILTDASTLSSSNLSGALPAIDGSALTGLSAVSIANLSDAYYSNQGGGSITADTWETHNLTQEDYDPDGIVTLSSNQFTLGAGKYWIHWYMNAYRFDNGAMRLRNVTDSSTVNITPVFRSGTGDYVSLPMIGDAYVNISSSKAFEIQS